MTDGFGNKQCSVLQLQRGNNTGWEKIKAVQIKVRIQSEFMKLKASVVGTEFKTEAQLLQRLNYLVDTDESTYHRSLVADGSDDRFERDPIEDGTPQIRINQETFHKN